MRRHPVLLGALAVVALVTGLVVGAGVAVPSNAVTVDGISLSQATVDRDLSAIHQSRAFACYLEASVLVRSGSAKNLPSMGALASQHTYSTAFVDFWLSEQVNGLLIRHLADRQHLVLDATALGAGRVDLVDSINATLADAAVISGQSAVCAPSGQAVLKTLPASMVTELIKAQAAGDIVLAHAAGYGLATTDMARYFQAHPNDFQTICLSVIQTSTKASAQLARASITSGQSFASVAQKVSTDQTSAANGGALGCFSANDGAYQTVANDVKGLAIGEVSQPLATNGSYLLLQVTSTQPANFASIVPAVRQAVLKVGSTRAAGELSSLTKDARVSVDPRYGRWSASSGIDIQAPRAPAPQDLLNPKA